MKWVRERRAQGKDDVQLIFIQEAHRVNDADFKVRPVHAVKGTWVLTLSRNFVLKGMNI